MGLFARNTTWHSLYFAEPWKVTTDGLLPLLPTLIILMYSSVDLVIKLSSPGLWNQTQPESLLEDQRDLSTDTLTTLKTSYYPPMELSLFLALGIALSDCGI